MEMETDDGKNIPSTYITSALITQYNRWNAINNMALWMVVNKMNCESNKESNSGAVEFVRVECACDIFSHLIKFTFSRVMEMIKKEFAVISHFRLIACYCVNICKGPYGFQMDVFSRHMFFFFLNRFLCAFIRNALFYHPLVSNINITMWEKKMPTNHQTQFFSTKCCL